MKFVAGNLVQNLFINVSKPDRDRQLSTIRIATHETTIEHKHPPDNQRTANRQFMHRRFLARKLHAGTELMADQRT